MNRTRPAALILVAVCLLSGSADAADRAFRFLAFGDVPLFHRRLKQSEKDVSSS